MRSLNTHLTWLVAIITLFSCGPLAPTESDKEDQNQNSGAEPTPSPTPKEDTNGTGGNGNKNDGNGQGQPPPNQKSLVPAGMSKSENGSFYIKLEWMTGPSAEDESQAKLTFNGADGKAAVAVKDVTFKPWMTIHGHGAPERAQRINPVEGAAQQYQVTGVYFSMSGPWDLKISANVNGMTDKIVLPVDVP